MSEAGSAAEAPPPILRDKLYRAPSVFTPSALIREARRQKGAPDGEVPAICLLDPDGDIVEHLLAEGRATRRAAWACYHTDLYAFEHSGVAYGVVGSAVGASFATLVAEQLFVAGCRLLVSLTSAGQILQVRPPPYFIVIDRALRDEGTSYQYLLPADFSMADASLAAIARSALSAAHIGAEIGATWTTDAPFRETEAAIAAARDAAILAVEMEAAALYAFASARSKAVLCLAHVTNQMGQVERDFEKGATSGAVASLQVVDASGRAWLARQRSGEISTDSGSSLRTRLEP